ncbi:PKD-like family lipoprotein [Snuella sedimenti]|uniref:PKD family protein n=1 Tax=Snuella sedimenti TaxID=2798802 RepID=A0A8J7J3X6_9FLAO|nr:PKD-like family lipoprotein [Snuella sedimenti]MBJ6368384.1 hypothetical protein [Snuella sedimenti]
MIKNIKIQFIFLLGCFIFMNSCSTDEGNYDYIEINEVVFDGLLEDYIAPRFENLKISTDQVKFTMDSDATGNYEYSWEAVSKNQLNNEIYKLSTDKNIDAQITLLPGNYTLYYLVKDLNTDVEFQYSANLEVINSIYEGWMVLSDVAGEARLDMVSLLEGEYKEIHDVLAFSQSPLTLSGTPGFVQCYPLESNFYGVYVSTSGNGTTKLDPDTFDWRAANNLSYEFVTQQPEDFEASNLHVKASRMAVVMADQNFYVFNPIFGVKYGTPQNVSFGGARFDVSPHFGKGDFFNGFTKMAFFDETNKKFVYHDGYFSNCWDVPSSDEMFTPGKDLLFMVSNEYNGNWDSTFAVLKDPNDGKNYIGFFILGSFSQQHYSEITAIDFDQAEHIAIDPNYAYIMYNVGSKVYEYDIFTGTTVEMLDKGSQEITKLEYRDFLRSGPDNIYKKYEKQLIVCTYDASGTEGSNGTMELYNVPPVQGQIELDTSYSGFGKIVSIAYRER